MTAGTAALPDSIHAQAWQGAHMKALWLLAMMIAPGRAGWQEVSEMHQIQVADLL